MQPFDDLQNVWMMFDDVKRVQGWMTMACHIYDSIYCKVMMIVVYDMQSKDIKFNAFIMWRKLNVVVEKKGLGTPVFKGFMVDNA